MQMRTKLSLIVMAVALVASGGLDGLSARAQEASPGETAEGDPAEEVDETAHLPQINTALGSENFLTVTTEQGDVYTAGQNQLELKLDETYTVTVSYRNDARPGPIKSRSYTADARFWCYLPESVKGEDSLTVKFLAANTTPSEASCTLRLHSDDLLYLKYDNGSAKMINANPTNDALLSSWDMFHDGAAIGSNSMSGIILPGDEYAGKIQFSFTTVATAPKGQSPRDAVPGETSVRDLADNASISATAADGTLSADVASGDESPDGASTEAALEETGPELDQFPDVELTDEEYAAKKAERKALLWKTLFVVACILMAILAVYYGLKFIGFIADHWTDTD